MLKIGRKSKLLAIAILVGGKSSRFGSDKGLFEISGKPLISHQLEILKELNYDIFLIAKSIKQVNNYIEKIDISKINAFIVDEMLSKSGEVFYSPMLGLYSTFKELKKLKYKKVLVLSCDNPLIKNNVLKYLIKRCKTSDCCIPQWANGFLEPLLTIYPIDKALLTARENLKKKNYKLTNLISESWKTNFISIEGELKRLDDKLLSFININDTEDIERLKEKKFLNI